MPARPPSFRILGFPVHVRPGFYWFMVLVVFIQGWQFGVPFALFLAVFTLLHELGHALAARRTGAEAQISLDFMAGYASFVPTRPLTKLERAGISFAGPGVQIVIGLVAYLIARREWAWPEPGHPIEAALVFAGPIIGLFNLLPVLPFDGGNIAEAFVEIFAKDKAHRVMMWFTVVVLVGAFVLMGIYPDYRRFLFFAVFPLLAIGAMFSGETQQRKRNELQQSLARAEALAWATGDLRFPPNTVPSPWFRAWQQLQAGDPGIAARVILMDFDDPQAPLWAAPDAAPVAALAQLVSILPRPLRQGRAFSSYVLSGVLLRTGQFYDDAFYAATAFGIHRAPSLAVHVARAAAALEDRPATFSWLRTAVDSLPEDADLAALLDAPEFAALRSDPEFAAAVSR